MNLVYLAGTGRSGSTLTELLLNAHSDMVTVGELQQWPPELRQAARRRCGCGATLATCAYWAELGRRVHPLAQPAPRLDHFFSPGPGRFYKPDLLRELRRPHPSAALRRHIETYAENNHRALTAFRDLWSQRYGWRPTWLVDASKNPYRLWWLLESGRFRIKVVHLVRDPRGFVCSTAGIGRGVPAGGARLRDALVAAAVWSFANDLVREVLARKSRPEDHLEVSYETLCRRPAEVLGSICQTIGCGYEPRMRERFRTTACHTVAGNVMRFERRDIELDERWRTALPWLERALVRVATGIPARVWRPLLAARSALRRSGPDSIGDDGAS